MGTVNEPGFTGMRIRQIGFVVDDLEAAIDRYRSTFGWKPWRVYDLVPPVHSGVTLRGVPVESGMRLAIADAGGIDIELIQPLWGPSQHAEYLAEHGPGINHVLVRRYVDGEEAPLDPASLELPELQAGQFGPISYSYLDGGDSLHTIIEVTQGSTAGAGMVPDRIIE